MQIGTEREGEIPQMGFSYISDQVCDCNCHYNLQHQEIKRDESYNQKQFFGVLNFEASLLL